MALTYKKLSELSDMTSSQIDTTTKIVVTTGSTKVNNNLKVTDLIVDDLATANQYRALSAKQGKKLQDEKAPIANPTFTGTVSGVSKTMVNLGNVDNTSDATKVSTGPIATALGLKSPISNPTFTGGVTIDNSGQITDNGNGGILLPIDTSIIISGDEVDIATEFAAKALKNSPIFTGLQTFADNTAAAALATGTVYKTSTGVLMIKY